MLNYKKTFDPEVLRLSAPPQDAASPAFVAEYEYTDELVLAVNVALATGRLLLLRGEPGAGKSTLAADVARLLHRRYYEQVVSSNTSAADLLYRMDHVGRIGDAMAGDTGAASRQAEYLEPGVLWWAFQPASAQSRGLENPRLRVREPKGRSWTLEEAWMAAAVVLIDEIDKAEPDFPNDLLVPLGSLSIHVRVSDFELLVQAPEARRPLVVVTTNEERDLPAAFLRRCVIAHLSAPTDDEGGHARLRAIARRHFGEQLDAKTLEVLAKRYFELRRSALAMKVRAPGTAEFLDAARAITQLSSAEAGAAHALLDATTWEFRQITESTLWKHGLPPVPPR
jgi:MoxR-like ATPase